MFRTRLILLPLSQLETVQGRILTLWILPRRVFKRICYPGNNSPQLDYSYSGKSDCYATDVNALHHLLRKRSRDACVVVFSLATSGQPSWALIIQPLAFLHWQSHSLITWGSFAQHCGVTQKEFLPLKAIEHCPVLNSFIAYQFYFSKCGFRWQLRPKAPVLLGL